MYFDIFIIRRELDKTEAKFQQLLKNLKERSQKATLTTSEIPESVLKPVIEKESFDAPVKVEDAPIDDIQKRYAKSVREANIPFYLKLLVFFVFKISEKLLMIILI